MTVSKITTPPSQKGVIDKINEVIDNLGGSITVDQTYDGTSANPQSGVAIEGELSTNYQPKLVSGTNIKTINNTSLLGSGNIDTTYTFSTGLTESSGTVTVTDYAKLLKNTATGTNSLTINGTNNTNQSGINIGESSQILASGCVAIGNNSTAGYGNTSGCVSIGASAYTNGLNSIAIGNSAVAKNGSIQIGKGTNNTANSLQIGFSNNLLVTLLDGTTGLIPYQRINSVTDNNTGSVKFWTGTQAEYDALVNNNTVDADTLYNITDNTSIPISILEALYPVGAIYIGTMSACPLQTLGVGTWQLVAQNRVLQGAGSGQNTGDTVEAGLPNITGNAYKVNGASSKAYDWYNTRGGDGAFSDTSTKTAIVNGGNLSLNYSTTVADNINFNASRSSSIYGNSSTVQPPAYLVNIWERIS